MAVISVLSSLGRDFHGFAEVFDCNKNWLDKKVILNNKTMQFIGFDMKRPKDIAVFKNVKTGEWTYESLKSLKKAFQNTS